MELADWKRKVAAEPLTRDQRGAIMGEFERLGIRDRGERLAICAELLDLDELGSTRDLVMGDAGRLVAMLRQARHRRELPDVLTALDDDGQDDEPDDDQYDDGLDGPQLDAGLSASDMFVRLLLMVAYRAAARSAQDAAGSTTARGSTAAGTRVFPSHR